MIPDPDLERRLADFYATELPPRAPDRVLDTALATIEHTRQRHAATRLLWRFPVMNSYAKVAVAAVAVIVIGATGVAVLRPGSSPGAGGPAAPSVSASPSPSPILSLTQSFTSPTYGLSVSYPAGWQTRAATTPWPGTEPPPFGSDEGDLMYDPALTDRLFVGAASLPLAGADGGEWAEAAVNLVGWDDTCATVEPIAIEGADGAVLSACPGSTPRAGAWAGDRGYLIWGYGLDDQYGTDEVAAFREILATVRLDPASADDAAP